MTLQGDDLEARSYKGGVVIRVLGKEQKDPGSNPQSALKLTG